MARRQFNDGQEVVYQDFNKIPQEMERELYERVIFELIQRAENAFFDDGHLVNYASPTSVSVNPGVGFQTDATQVAPESKKRLLYRGSSTTLNLQAPDGVNDRIDIVVCRAKRVDGATESRKFKNAMTNVISNENLVVSNEWETEFDLVEGTPAGSPVAPATPAGWIKLAELYVNAVTGMSGSGDVTDFRVLMPVGGAVVLNTLGKQRVTAGAAIPLSTLITDIDTLLKFGYQNYTDYDDLGADPAAPVAGKLRLYFKGGTAFFRAFGGAITPVGSGGGGGGGANWFPNDGIGPVEDTENNEKVWLFEDGAGQKLTLFIRVPSSYIAGRQLKTFISAYSPSAANTWKLSATTYLVRKNLDAITSVANSYASTNGNLTNTVANQYREIELDLTNATGQINGFSVSAGDVLKVELTRAGGTTDTADVRFLPSGTEFKIA